MTNRNISLGKTRLLIATTLTLLLSVAQSDQSRHATHDLARNGLPDQGFDLAYSRGFTDMRESGLAGNSNTSLAVSNADGFGELSLVEMHSDDSRRMHFNFRSNITEENLSATLVSNGPDYSLTFDLPSGQVLLENDTVSIITPNDFSQLSLSEQNISGLGSGRFSAALNKVFRGSDLAGFSMSMAESFAENDLLSLVFAEQELSKSSDQHTDGMWACGGALTMLAAANAALAAAIAATYFTVGAAAAAIAGAVAAIGAAMTLVDQYCMQM